MAITHTAHATSQRSSLGEGETTTAHQNKKKKDENEHEESEHICHSGHSVSARCVVCVLRRNGKWSSDGVGARAYRFNKHEHQYNVQLCGQA